MWKKICLTGLALAVSMVVGAHKYIDLSIDSIHTIMKTETLTTPDRLTLLLMLGIGYNYKGDYDSGRFYLNRALALPQGREYNGGRILINIANSYAAEGRYAEALNYYMEALKISEEQNIFYIDRQRALVNIGDIFFQLGNHSRAFYYADLVNKDSEGKGYTYLNSHAFYIIASIALAKGELDEAEEKMMESYRIACEGGQSNLEYQSFAMDGMARIYLQRKNVAKALEYANTSLEIAEQFGNPPNLVRALHTLSDIYLEQERYRESEQAALRALALKPAIIDVEPSLAFNLGTINMFRGNTEQANHYFRTYSEKMKRRTDQNFRETLFSMEIQYETEKKELYIASLEKTKELYSGIGIASAIALLSIIGMLLFRHSFIRQKRRLAEQQVKQMVQERQIAVAQASLDGETTERSRLARDLHDGLGSLLAIVLFKLKEINASSTAGGTAALHFNEPIETLKKSIDELRRITHGLMPGSLEKHGLKMAVEDLCRSIPCAEYKFYGDNTKLGKYMEATLYRCTYELVANALKYANPSHIRVQLVVNANLVSLNVQDDGDGFDPSGIQDGTGLENIRTRIAPYNGSLHILSSPGEGTEVNIEIEDYQHYSR